MEIARSQGSWQLFRLFFLQNCQDKPVKVLLFGDACKDYWKLQAGVVIALISPQFAEQQNSSQSKGNRIYRIFKAFIYRQPCNTKNLKKIASGRTWTKHKLWAL